MKLKKIKQIRECQYWELLGLLALAKTHRKQLDYIEKSVGDLLGIEDTNGHIGDFVWGGVEGGADSLLSNEEIERP